MGMKKWLTNTFTPMREESSEKEEIIYLDEIAEKIKEKYPKLESKERNFLSFYYNLKELQIRLQNYDDLNSKNKDKKTVASLVLKQKWINKVDSVLKGNQKLVDAFFVIGSIKEINKLDLNENLKNILREKIPKYYKWIETSEKEYRKNYLLNKQKIKEVEKEIENDL